MLVSCHILCDDNVPLCLICRIRWTPSTWLRQSKLWTRTETYSLHLTGQGYCTASSSVGRPGPLSWSFRHIHADILVSVFEGCYIELQRCPPPQNLLLTPPQVPKVKKDSGKRLSMTIGHCDCCLKFGNTISKTHYCYLWRFAWSVKNAPTWPDRGLITFPSPTLWS